MDNTKKFATELTDIIATYMDENQGTRPVCDRPKFQLYLQG
jgi:hypothetical protein